MLNNIPTFLDNEDIIRITGKKRAKDQCNTLQSMGYKFETSARGEPLIDRLYYAQRFGFKLQSTPKVEMKITEPNFNNLRLI